MTARRIETFELRGPWCRQPEHGRFVDMSEMP
jgi:hypothetical protein